MAGLEEALEGVDYITNILRSCPNENCMLNKLINVSGANICDYARLFDSSSDSNFGVRISSGNLEPDQTTGNIPFAFTTHIHGEARIIVDINRICNETRPLIILETLLHELIHAFFYEKMESLGWPGDQLSEGEYFDELMEIMLNENPGKTHHEIMTLYYLEPMANTLRILNNNHGEPSDYYGLILYGLNSTSNGVNNIIRDYFNLTDLEIVEAYATSINTVVTPSTLNFTNCE